MTSRPNRIDLAPFEPHLDTTPTADILRRCLDVAPTLPESTSPPAAIPWDQKSREIERLKMYRPREASGRATGWLEQALGDAQATPEDAGAVDVFASALSTWAGLQRTLGQVSDAALATHHSLRILSPRPVSTRAGFAVQRAAYVLGDLGDVESGLECARQAVAIHQTTPGGLHHAGTALAGLGAYQLFYRRAFAEARAAFTTALHALRNEDEMLLVGASHGVAYSYLMEERYDDARESLAALRQLVSEMAPDQDLRLRWLEAELHAASGDTRRALKIYDEVFTRSLDITEASGQVLISFDAARLLVDAADENDEWARWHRRIRPIALRMSGAEQATLEPYLDALASGDLERDLLDQTAVAYRKATNRMLLGMGRPGAAGRPELMGKLAA